MISYKINKIKMLKPSIWEKSDKNTSADDLLLSYKDDMDDNKGLIEISKNRNTEGNGQKIKIMTYNVQYWEDVNYTKTYSKILGLLDEIDADVIGLQEVIIPCKKINNVYNTGNKYIDDLFNNLGKKYLIYTHCISKYKCPKKTMYGNVFLVKKHINVIGHQNIKLPAKVSRGAIIIIIEYYCKKIYLVNTHLDVFDHSGKTRQKQITLILDILKSLDQNNKIIIMGDFNCCQEKDYNSNEKNWLEKNSVSSVDFDSIKIFENNNYIDYFEGCKYSVWSGRRVDYIFGKNISKYDKYIYYTTLSDHVPLIFNFYI